MARIKKTPIAFWSYIVGRSFIAVFNTKETRDSLLKFVGKWVLAIIAGFGVVATLGWVGWIKGFGNNTLTYLFAFASGLLLKFLSNLVIIPANLYFEVRGDADKLNWGDVKSSVWKEPEDRPVIVGVKLEREEAHSVQFMRAILRSVVKDGQIWFNGYGEYMLPIRKPNGVIAWMKSFSHEKPRNILLASLSGEKIQIRVKRGDDEQVLEFDSGTYDIEIGFTAEGGVDGYVFKGFLLFDGKSIDLKKIK